MNACGYFQGVKRIYRPHLRIAIIDDFVLRNCRSKYKETNDRKEYFFHLPPTNRAESAVNRGKFNTPTSSWSVTFLLQWERNRSSENISSRCPFGSLAAAALADRRVRFGPKSDMVFASRGSNFELWLHRFIWVISITIVAI